MAKGRQHKGGGRGSNQHAAKGRSKQRSRGSGSTYQTGGLDTASAVSTATPAPAITPPSSRFSGFNLDEVDRSVAARWALRMSFDERYQESFETGEAIPGGEFTRLLNETRETRGEMAFLLLTA